MMKGIRLLEVTKMINRLNGYSGDLILSSIISSLNIQYPEMNDISKKFFNIVNKLLVESAQTNYVNRKIYYVFINEGLDSSRHVT